jgi:DNA-binding beta-propeller fold protein YncE
MSDWEPGIIPLAANFQNNTTSPLDARQVVPNQAGLEQIQFPYPGLTVFQEDGKHMYLCINIIPDIANDGVQGGVVNPIYWKKIHDESEIDGGEF